MPFYGNNCKKYFEYFKVKKKRVGSWVCNCYLVLSNLQYIEYQLQIYMKSGSKMFRGYYYLIAGAK